MRSATVFCALLVAVVAVPLHPAVTQWNKFKLAYGKNYNAEEEVLRFDIFKKNLERIEKHNTQYEAGLSTYKLGVTKFADITPQEFKSYLTLFESQVHSSYEDVFQPPSGIVLPESIDYRKKNAVNPIKNQGGCGSCWAFSTVGSLESIYFLKTGKLYSLSEQNLVDCSQEYGNEGCNGGLMRSGYNYIRDEGIETESEYPYDAVDQVCRFNKTKSVLKVKGFTTIKAGSESDLQAAVATKGPVAVAVDASDWQLYSEGIFKTDSDFVMLDHGVVAIGYGVEKGIDYWIVRNSWGSDWGEEGYIRIARNAGNQVGISDDACFPNV